MSPVRKHLHKANLVPGQPLVVQHDFGTKDVIVQVFDAQGYQIGYNPGPQLRLRVLDANSVEVKLYGGGNPFDVRIVVLG